MDQFIKNSIDARYNAFTSSYVINDDLKKKIDDLFKKINKLGEESKDVMDFENKFASSPLNNEYTNLFTEIASSSQVIIPKSVDEEKSKTSEVMDEIASDAKYLVDDITMPARRKAREELDSKLRDTPLGKIEQLSNTANVFKRIFKK